MVKAQNTNLLASGVVHLDQEILLLLQGEGAFFAFFKVARIDAGGFVGHGHAIASGMQAGFGRLLKVAIVKMHPCLQHRAVGGQRFGVAAVQPRPVLRQAGRIKARIAKAIAFINAIDKAAINAGAMREISWKAGQNTRRMVGKDFLLHQAMPQFYFHQTAAYSILRHNGVELAKRDFMGAVPRMTQS